MTRFLLRHTSLRIASSLKWKASSDDRMGLQSICTIRRQFRAKRQGIELYRRTFHFLLSPLAIRRDQAEVF
jgi:hypothetical protein